MEKRLTSQVHKTIRTEVNTALQQQQDSISTSVMMAMRESGAVTPAFSQVSTPQNQEEQILQLLREGSLNQAFAQVSFRLEESLISG